MTGEPQANRRIWAIAGPAVVANSAAPLVGLVDTWVIGHLPGPEYLAIVGVGATIFSFLFWAFGFLRMSTTGLIAQAHGAENSQRMARILTRSASLGLLFGLLLLLCQKPLLSAALWALAPDPSIQNAIADYYSIRIWAAPATLVLYAITGFLIGTARARQALILQLVLNISNGALNLIFVLGLDMGVSGVALGSLLAEWIAALYGLSLVGSVLGVGLLRAVGGQPETWALQKIYPLLSVNGYIFMRTLLLMTALALVTRKSAELGLVPLAVNQILFTFLLLISLGLDAFAHAVEALSGAAYGRGSVREFRFWVVRTTLHAGAAAVLYSLVFLIFGPVIVHTLTDVVSVQEQATSMVALIAILPLVSVWCYQFDGIYIGATEGKGMVITMVAAFAVYLLVLDSLTDRYGLQGLWIALILFMAARGLGQLLYYPLLERALAKNVTQTKS